MSYTSHSGRSSTFIHFISPNNPEPVQIFVPTSSLLAPARFNSTFLLPIHEPLPSTSSGLGSGSATPTSATNLPSISQSPQATFLGYTPVSLLTLLRHTGCTPTAFHLLVTTPAGAVNPQKVFPSLESVRNLVPGPVVVFPEGTTSNGRALLRFAEGVLGDVKSVPVRGFNVWVLFFKHPPPSSYSPTATHSTPPSGTGSNPLPHLFGGMLKTLVPQRMTVRILHPHSAPSSGDFLPSETLSLSSTSSTTTKTKQPAAGIDENVLGECCKTLLLQLGRVKSVGLGWEDKDGFLGFVKDRRAGSAGQGRKKDK
ncbi:hypothetical protein QFC21_006809 [Naganishia friedmannii]|uniref:Uncharacterized protein n=1 Tax=Naganishia friedmannii TaxID=89922 RepID=A0ACC2V092_9TREE|nr:hypothetical protein QFC21_006809 [Naganishia friedmannii]